jgi:hypothetical protein
MVLAPHVSQRSKSQIIEDHVDPTDRTDAELGENTQDLATNPIG